jgi:hypothetical protein
MRKKRGFREFTEQEIILPEGDREGTVYRFKNRKWLDLICEEVGTRKHITIAATPRSGKSILGVAYLLWRCIEFAEPCQCIYPSKETAVAFFADKVLKIVKYNPRLEKEFSQQGKPVYVGTGNTVRRYFPAGNGGHIRNMFNEIDIKGYTSQMLFATEASLLRSTHDASIIDLAMQRQWDIKDKGRWFIESSVVGKNKAFVAMLEQGTASFLSAQCPKCEKYIRWGERGRVKGWETAETEGDIEEYLECPECKERYTEKDRDNILKTAKLEHKNPTAGDFSLYMDWFFSSARSIREVAVAEWRLKDDPNIEGLRALNQNYYSAPTDINDEKMVLMGSSDTMQWDYNTLKSKVNFKLSRNDRSGIDVIRTGIDVQKGFIYHVTIGYSKNTQKYRVIDWGTYNVFAEEEKEGKRVERFPTEEEEFHMLDTVYEIAKNRGSTQIWIDSSYNPTGVKDRSSIELWSVSKPDVHLIKGRAASVIEQYSSKIMIPISVMPFMRAKDSIAGNPSWYLNVDALKDKLVQIIFQNKFEFPVDVLKSALIRHYVAETKEYNTKTGKSSWQPVVGRRHDYWDASVYALAGLLLDMGLNEDAGKMANPNDPRAKIEKNYKEVPQANGIMKIVMNK